jgi:predicted TPR repeat methyltransferase
VWEFTLRGYLSIGIEGSDYSRRHARAEWRILNDRLFTADITKPFSIKRDGAAASFSLITAWEVLEHIEMKDLAALFTNIRKHLKTDGLFVCSIATFEDRDAATGAVWHKTIQPRHFWEQVLRESGLIPVLSPFVTGDYPRGSGNVRVPDWNADLEPHKGFHLVCKQMV